MAWMLQLEDQRILKLPEPPPPPVVAPVKGKRPAPLPPPPASVPDLTKLATDADPRVRRRAAIAMGRVGLREAVPALTALLADTDADVRQAGLFALGLIGDRSASTAVRAAAPGSQSDGARPRRRSARPDGRRGRGAGDRQDDRGVRGLGGGLRDDAGRRAVAGTAGGRGVQARLVRARPAPRLRLARRCGAATRWPAGLDLVAGRVCAAADRRSARAFPRCVSSPG